MSLQKYQIYDVTDDKVIGKDLYFNQVKERIASVWTDNEMQYNKIMRCNKLKVLNQYVRGLGYIIEEQEKKRRGTPNDYKHTIFAYYEKDHYVCDGTIYEIAEFTGKTIQRLQRIACRSYKKYYEGKPGYMWLEEIGDVREEDGQGN